MNSNMNLEGLRNKKVLITGGLGFIGSNLAVKCLALGAQVTIYDNLDPHSGGNIYNINDFSSSVELVFSDILDFDKLSQEISNKDIVYNCAASTSHPFSMKEPLINLDVNSRGVINILESIRRFNPTAKLVHLGTTTQLGKLHYQPADEFHPEFPMDIYSANKMVSEKYVLIYSQAFNLDATVLRLSNVFGPRASIHSPEFTFNNYFIGLALQGKAITVFKPGKQLRNIIYVDDAVDALIAASISTRTSKQTFFVAGDKHYSVSQIADSTVERIGGQVNYIDWPKERKAIDVGDAVINNSKAKSTLNWEPKIGLSEGLDRTKDYYSACIKKYIK